MAPSSKTKAHKKPLQGRPVATSGPSQPAVQHASSSLTALSSFSPSSQYFAHLSLAVDKHRLNIYDAVGGLSVAQHVFASGRATAMNWLSIGTNDQTSPSRRKRQKRTDEAQDPPSQPSRENVVVGCSDGTLVIVSPIHGSATHTFSHPTSTASIVSLTATKQKTIWTASSDGVLRHWDLDSGTIIGTWRTEDTTPYTSLAINPTDNTKILVANHAIRLLEPDTDEKVAETSARFTGHASPIKDLLWDSSQAPPSRFVSMAEADRAISIWQLPQNDELNGQMVGSIQLDSDARAIAFSSSIPKSQPAILAIAASGKVTISLIPKDLSLASTAGKKPQSIASLKPRSTLSPPSGSSHPPVVAATFVAGQTNSLRIARVVGGVKPVFDLIAYLDNEGEFIPEVSIKPIQVDVLEQNRVGVSNKRYAEHLLAVGTGTDLGHDQPMDDADPIADGELDVELAEMSLGQRLAAMTGEERQAGADSDDDSDQRKTDKPSKRSKGEVSIVPAASLARTLTQALHSSDSKLLETCLAHSDLTLIRNTVGRLPPQLAVPLINACMERLGRGARGGNMKGSGGGASSQRGTALVSWVKTVLVMHSGHLMTMPDLVARLAGLHSIMTTRLSLQSSLLSLSGRLEMVLAQVELRSSVAPAPLVPRKGKPTVERVKPVSKYVEGESDDSEDEQQPDVEVEMGDDDDVGSIEDVEFGADSNEDEEGSEDGSEVDSDEDEEDEEGLTMSGFIDDEAEENTDEEDEDSEEE